MSTYELMVVYSPEVTEDQQKKSLERIAESRGGKIVSCEFLGKRSLTYPIKKHSEGIYTVWVVDLPAAGPAQVENDLRVDEQVLRHLLVRTRIVQVVKAEPVKKGLDGQLSRKAEGKLLAEKVETKKKLVKKTTKKVSKKK